MENDNSDSFVLEGCEHVEEGSVNSRVLSRLVCATSPHFLEARLSF